MTKSIEETRKTTIKIKLGDPIPSGARYLSTVTEAEVGASRYEWRSSPGFWGAIPIFGRETLYRITPQYKVTYLIYEIDQDPQINK